jgi:hypothetical protein
VRDGAERGEHQLAGGDEVSILSSRLSSATPRSFGMHFVGTGGASDSRVDPVRHRMEVTDRPGLEAASCECYGIARRAYDRLLGPPEGATTPYWR